MPKRQKDMIFFKKTCQKQVYFRRPNKPNKILYSMKVLTYDKKNLFFSENMLRLHKIKKSF